MGQGEGQAAEDPAVEEGDDGENEGPADSAVAELVVVGIAADGADVVVVPTGGEGQDADGQADTWR